MLPIFVVHTACDFHFVVMRKVILRSISRGYMISVQWAGPCILSLLECACTYEHHLPSFCLVGRNAPSLVELVSLPITDWHSLGLQLGVTHHRLKTIQANNAQYPDSLERCMADTFETWLNNDHEPSYEKIGKALCVVGMPMLAQQFCRQQGEM